MALSGGSTPRPLHQRLSHCPIDWAKVTVTQVDERWVDEDHPDSNARLIRETLLCNAAENTRFVSMKTPSPSPFEAEEDVSEALAFLAEGIDVVVLGMGSDGHTASFFPAAPTLGKALDSSLPQLCVAIQPPVAPHPRMTLSLSAINSARHLYLHITGDDKWQVLQKALQPGAIEDLPIRSVLFNQQPALEIYYASRS